MSYAPARPQVPSSPALTANDATAAFDGDLETGSGANQQDGWLVSFIDILVLLLTLFVLLLTYQQDGTVLMDKAGQGTTQPLIATVTDSMPFRPALELPALLSAPETVADIFNIGDALLSDSITDPGSTEPVETDPTHADLISKPALPASPAAEDTVNSIEPLTIEDISSDADTASEEKHVRSLPAAETNDTAPDISGPMEAFLHTISNSELRERVEVSAHGGGVTMEISDSILFKPASAALTPSGMALLQDLAGALEEHAYLLSIEGHTDNIPIKTARFPSNWELSTARAAIVARHLVKRNISPERVRAIGYADTRPRADNLTAEGRSRNRRVSLVLQAPSTHY